MTTGLFIDTDLVEEADELCRKAYKLLIENQLLDIASSISKMGVNKELSSSNYLNNIKEEVEEIIDGAKKVKEKCAKLNNNSISIETQKNFPMESFSTKSMFSNSITENNKIQETIVEVDNPNYNNNLDSYISNIKRSLGLDEVANQLGIKITTTAEIINILEILKKNMTNNKTEVAQIEVILKQLKQYDEIDKFEKSYKNKEGYNSSYKLSETDKLEQKLDQIQVVGGSAVSVGSVYIEYGDIKDYLSLEQQQIMAYIYKVEGSNQAYEYYKKLEDQINQLKGMEKAINIYNQIKKAGEKAGSTTTTSSLENIYGGSSYGSTGNYYNAKKKSQEYMTEYMHSVIKGTVNGIEGFKESWGNCNNGNATELDYQRMYLIQALQNDKDLAEGLEETYGFGESVGNMLPTVVVGAIVTIATEGAGAPAVVTKVLSTAVTSSMIFGSTYASKNHQNLLNGYTKEDSKKSAVVSAISETALEEALGTIPGIGIGKGTGNVMTNMLKEGSQEAIQQLVENLGDNVTLGTELDLANCINDSGKAFIYGALISGTFEAGQAIVYNGAKIVINSDILAKLKSAVNNKSEKEVQEVLRLLTESQQPKVDEVPSETKNLFTPWLSHSKQAIGAIGESVKKLGNEMLKEYKENPHGGYVDLTGLNNLNYTMSISDIYCVKEGYQKLLNNAIALTLNISNKSNTPENYSYIYNKIRECKFESITRKGNARIAAIKVAVDLSTKNPDFIQGSIHTEMDAILATLISQNIEPTESNINKLKSEIKSGNYGAITSRLGARKYITSIYNAQSQKLNKTYQKETKWISLDTIKDITEHYGTLPSECMSIVENIINNQFNGKFNQNIDYNQNFMEWILSHYKNLNIDTNTVSNFLPYLNQKYGYTFLGRLSIGEAIAVYNYTMGSGVFQRYVGTNKYDPLNQNSHIHSEIEIQKNIFYLDSALKKSGGLKKNQIFHRGDEFDKVLTYMGINNYNDLKKCVGKTKVNKGYLSTGVSKSGAFGGSIHWKIKCFKGKQYGAYVNEISAYYDATNEYEFIFRRNQKIRFDKVYKKNGKIEIEATILGIEGYDNH